MHQREKFGVSLELWVVLAVIGASLLSRSLIGLAAPGAGGDWATYRVVAENILYNGCVSFSPVASGVCLPHWGGNQLPGFPTFIALTWSISPSGLVPVILFQSGVFAAAAGYLTYRLLSVTPVLVAAGAGLLIALSPLTVPWGRFASTETLSLAATIWVIAELVASFRIGRLRVPWIGIALAIAIFLRYDSILLSIPIAVAGFTLHRPLIAVRQGTLICMVVMILLGSWWVRSVSVGLGWYPNPYFSSVHGSLPTGYLSWAKTWVTSQYEALGYLYPIHVGTQYSDISVQPSVHVDYESRAEAERLLSALAEHDGKPFPKEIDQAFDNLAESIRLKQPIRQYVYLPAVRAWKLWFNPLNSAGWPVAIGFLGASPIGVPLLDVALNNPVAALTKVGTAVYKLGLLVAVSFLAVFYWGRLSHFARFLIIAALSYSYGRTLILTATFFVESRYTIQAVPFLEVALVVGIATLARRHSLALQSLGGPR